MAKDDYQADAVSKTCANAEWSEAKRETPLSRELESDQTEYRTLDDGTLREAAENDPQGFIKRRAKTLIIDEVQRVPSLLPEIKKAVDEDTRPGQYLLTGSANIQSLPTVRESLAGRIAKIRLRPLAQGEVIDFLIEREDNALLGVEIKAGSAISKK